MSRTAIQTIVLLTTITLLVSCGQTETTNETNETTTPAPTPIINEETAETMEENLPENTETDRVMPGEESSTGTVGTEDTNTEVEAGDPNPSATTEIEAPAANEENQTSSTDIKVVRLEQTYTSPAGNDSVAFELSMNGETIEGITVTPLTEHPVSIQRINSFGDIIGTFVTGKKVSELDELDAIGGSSLTTNAFKEAIKSL
ncbi:MAG: hypothetical protein H6767_05830 [Candidatus Peribacteria bacterium]|nr:MAG: hypothetical protein H6767_05830 [Candidatus Peribacteria bacterium]